MISNFKKSPATAVVAVLLFFSPAGVPSVVAKESLRPLSKDLQLRQVTVVFVPTKFPGDLTLLKRAQREGGFSLALMSPSLGRDLSPLQTYLDIGQGARIDSVLYKSELPRQAGRFKTYGRKLRALSFAAIKRRAGAVPGDIKPGRLASILKRNGVGLSYRPSDLVVEEETSQPPALAVVDYGGAIERADILTILRPIRSTVDAEVLFAWTSEWRGLVRHLKPRGRIFLIGTPPVGGTAGHQLPVAVSSGSSRSLTSSSTRTAGLITSTDIAPSVTHALGLGRSGGFQGRPVDLEGKADAAKLKSLDARLSVIEQRRLTALAAVAVVALLLALVLGLAVGKSGVRVAVRATALTLLWLPAVMLVTAALRPTAAVEYALIAGLGLLLGYLSALRLPLPTAPIVAVAVSLGATLVDLALGSALTSTSLMGSNPAYGARFYGIGNELEAYLGISYILALGLFCDNYFPKHRLLVITVAGYLLALLLAWSRLGADIGALPVLLVGASTAALLTTSWRVTKAKVLKQLGLALVLVATLFVFELLTGAGSHISDSFKSGDGLGTVLERRLLLTLHTLLRADTVIFALAALVAISLLIRFRKVLLRPIAGDNCRATRATVIGAIAATLTGFVANDSGPFFLIIGTVEVIFFLAYFFGVRS